MDTTVLILQIATILVSICSLTVNLLSSMRENNKKNYIQVVTDQRLKNKSIIRDNIKDLLASSNPHTIESLITETVNKCAESAAAVETVLKKIYPEDDKILCSVDNLIFELAKQVKNGDNEQAVITARENLFYEFSVYDLADWRFIKQQANGKRKDSDEFDKIYSQTREQYDKNNFDIKM